MSDEILAALISSAAALAIAALGYWGGLRAAQRSFDAMLTAERQERQEERRHEQVQTLQALSAELAWNARIIQEGRIHVGWAWVPLSMTSLWSSKPIGALYPTSSATSSKSQPELSLDSTLSRSTQTVRLIRGSGAMDTTLKSEATQARTALEGAAQSLDRHLRSV